MTKQQKIENAVEAVTHSENDYPFPYNWVGGKLVVASLDHDGSPKLGIYTRTELLEYFEERLKEYFDEEDAA
jgi:hypothetical protein